eukprot:scaffold21153_cov34-Tisochrysis_lutea.AAC.3
MVHGLHMLLGYTVETQKHRESEPSSRLLELGRRGEFEKSQASLRMLVCQGDARFGIQFMMNEQCTKQIHRCAKEVKAQAATCLHRLQAGRGHIGLCF